ncbi:MAG: hypothetical protein C5B43_03750 [Verrucomicrobia bacterium]|nr:MAG: hypothetical protein C5B43_03750 [Verrucomicrobiota bacterium]
MHNTSTQNNTTNIGLNNNSPQQNQNSSTSFSTSSILNREVHQITDTHPRGLISLVLKYPYNLAFDIEFPILRHLFSRSSSLSKFYLSDLFYFGMCNKNLYQLILIFLNKITNVTLYINEPKQLNPNCFNITDPQSGIIPAMIIGLSDKKPFFTNLKSVFQNKLIEYMYAYNPFDLRDGFEKSIETLSFIAKFPQANDFIDTLLKELCINTSSRRISPQIQLQGITLLKILLEKKCIPHNPTVIEKILNTANTFLSDSNDEILSNALQIISILANLKLLNAVNTPLLKSICSKVEQFLYNSNENISITAEITYNSLANLNLSLEPEKENQNFIEQSSPQNTNGNFSFLKCVEEDIILQDQLESSHNILNQPESAFSTRSFRSNSPNIPISSRRKLIFAAEDKITYIENVCSQIITSLSPENPDEVKLALDQLDKLYDKKQLQKVKSETIELIWQKLVDLLNHETLPYLNPYILDSITLILFKFVNSGLCDDIATTYIELTCFTSIKMLYEFSTNNITLTGANIVGLFPLLGQFAEKNLLQKFSKNFTKNILFISTQYMNPEIPVFASHGLKLARQIITTNSEQIKNLDLIENVCKKVSQFLTLENTNLLQHSLELIDQLAQTNLAKAINIILLWNIFEKIQILLNHKQNTIAESALTTCNHLKKANLLEDIELKVINATLSNLQLPPETKFNDFLQQLFISTINYADATTLNKNQLNMIAAISLKINNILNSTNSTKIEIIFGSHIIGLFTNCGWINSKDNNLPQNIFEQIKLLLDNKDEEIVICAVSVLSEFLAADLTTIESIKANLLQIDSTIINKILNLSIEQLDNPEKEVIITGMLRISLLAEAGLIDLESREKINDKAPFLFENPSEKVTNVLLRMIDKLANS